MTRTKRPRIQMADGSEIELRGTVNEVLKGSDFWAKMEVRRLWEVSLYESVLRGQSQEQAMLDNWNPYLVLAGGAK